MPRGRAPLGAHGGEPDAVDVGRQAAEDPAGEVQRDVRPRRSRGIRHRSIRPCKYDREKTAAVRKDTHCVHKPAAKREQRRRRALASQADRQCIEHLARATRGESKGSRGSRDRGASCSGGKECWRLTGNRRPRQGESCSSSCCSGGGGGGGGPASGTAWWAGLVGKGGRRSRSGGRRLFEFLRVVLGRESC